MTRAIKYDDAAMVKATGKKWKHLRKIKVPSIVLIGEKDEYFSAPLRKIKSFFEKEEFTWC